MALKYNWKVDDIINEGRTTKEAIEEIKEWLSKIEFPKITDEQIVLFLLSCNNDISATKDTIMAFYKVRKNSPELFNNRNMENDDLKQMERSGEYCIFPTHTKENYTVFYHGLSDSTYWRYNMIPSMKILFMALEARLIEAPPTGLIAVMDMKGVGLMHLTRIKIGAVKAFFTYLQEGLPIQLKQIHILNVVYFFDKILAIIKPFMKKELMEKLILHHSDMDMEEFFEKYLPSSCFPCDYKGDLPTIQEMHANTMTLLKENTDYFDAEEEQRRAAERH